MAVTRMDTPEWLSMQSVPVSPLGAALCGTSRSLETGGQSRLMNMPIWLTIYKTEKQKHLLMFVKILHKMALKCHYKTWRILTTFTQWKKNGSVDVTITRAIRHQKHLAQSGRSTRSVVDIFNTLSVYTKEPIREQEIKVFWSSQIGSFFLNQIFVYGTLRCRLRIWKENMGGTGLGFEF